MNKKTETYGIVRFQRQYDKAEDFVRVGAVKNRLEAVAKASQIIPYLGMKDIRGVELKTVRLVLE